MGATVSGQITRTAEGMPVEDIRIALVRPELRLLRE